MLQEQGSKVVSIPTSVMKWQLQLMNVFTVD